MWKCCVALLCPVWQRVWWGNECHHQTGQQPPTIEASSYYGSFGSWRYGLKATGATGDGTQPGDVDYTVSTTRFTTHGYRDHSGAQKI